MPYDLSNFDLAAMLQCSAALRAKMEGAVSSEDIAQRVVQFLRDNFRDPETGNESCALVRFYQTMPFSALEPGVQLVAKKALGAATSPAGIQFLSLLATAGDEPSWNNRRRSTGHQAIPLASVEMVSRAPMIAQLIREMGLDIASVVSPSSVMLEREAHRNYNVFYVGEALNSPYIPAQRDFVVPHGIRSVVGFGGVARTDLFAVILFTKVHIPRQSAERLRSLALDIRRNLFELEQGSIWGRPRVT